MKKKATRKKRAPRRIYKENARKKGRRMLMNVVDPEEIRVAILDANGRLEDLYIERGGLSAQHGNIYKGKVQNIEPSLEAAFIDIGGEKNGFLHVSDVIPPHGGYEDILKKRRRKKPKESQRLPIDKLLYKGQEVLVQVTREALHNKGPSLTTYVSLPGRYLVLMPSVNKRGVSKRISDERERKELKRALDELSPPEDLGFIIRTAGMGRRKEDLKYDLDYLVRLWEAIKQKAQKGRPPSVIYEESELTIRAIRDYLYEDIVEVLIDSESVYDVANEFLSSVMPGYVDRAALYQESEPLFSHFRVEDEIDRLFAHSVPLPSGGEIVIEQTEAMVTIDVNTGRFKSKDSRKTILSINREAAREIARQLRMRDMGGLIMIDFIDMELAEDRTEVERYFAEAIQQDRARISTLPISPLGVMEMTRQRVRKSLERTMYSVCPACGGTGKRKNTEPLALQFVRHLRERLDERTGTLYAYLHPAVALEVCNERRADITALEQTHESRVKICTDPALKYDSMRFEWLEV